MKKRMLIMLIFIGILFGSIFIYKIVYVSTMKVGYSQWEPQLKASGSIRAIKGVNVTTELAGLVTKIYFTPGATVKEGTLLVQLNADPEIGQLQSLQAQAGLAQITYTRDQAQYKIHGVSKQTVDADFQNLKSLQAQVAQQAATVAKKTIQTLDPIYVDFYMPQQTLAQIKVGQAVSVTSDIFPGKSYMGKITTIEPAIDASTRNVEVEATIPNPNFQLTPGMYATVSVVTGGSQRYLTLPQTAITFNPYGNIVFVVTEKGKDDKGKPILIANQAFVQTGQTRGDQVTIIKGLQAGQTVVTSGQLKLKNGNQIAVNNSVVPQNSPNPVAPDEH
jgi:membrane fusion protein (multidrug efflux system)